MKPWVLLFMISAAASLAFPSDLLANVRQLQENMFLESYDDFGRALRILSGEASKPDFTKNLVRLPFDESDGPFKPPFIGRDGQAALTPKLGRAGYYESFNIDGLPPAWSD